ncbi:hypothetical protein ABWK22_01580 [Gottfriedia acidiceleris]|uniref:hypothetical protein n=1 Tax=Gottfriedia acidiceleris TaxID=371036 RepID=UPI003396A0E9
MVEQIAEQTEVIDQPKKVDEAPLLPLPLRVLTGFQSIGETTFWPSEITNVVEILMTPTTFKEFNDILTPDTSNSLSNMEKNIRDFKQNYDGYLNELEKTPNVFSFDVDYI